MRLLNKLLILLVILMIPLVSISASVNIITRMPDIYAYEFTRTQIMEKIGLDADADELSGLFSDYLTGSASEFQITAEYQGREKDVFSPEDQIGMQNVRKVLNAGLAAAIAMGVLSAAIVYYFIRLGHKERVRTAFRISVALFIALWLAAVVTAATGAGMMLLQSGLFAGGFDAEGVLGLLLSGSFLKHWLIFSIVGSAVVMFIFGSVLFKFTKERRMFVV